MKRIVKRDSKEWLNSHLEERIKSEVTQAIFAENSNLKGIEEK